MYRDDTPISYWIMTENGNIVRRNEIDMRKSPDPTLIKGPTNVEEKGGGGEYDEIKRQNEGKYMISNVERNVD